MSNRARFRNLPRWLTGILCASILLTSHAASAAAPANLVLLIRENRNESGDMVPVRTEIRHFLSYLERHAHIHFEIRRYPYPRLMEKVKNGEGLAFGLSKTSRYPELNYSEPIFTNYVWMVVRRDMVFPFNEMNDLKGKKIGILRGMIYSDEFDAQRNVLFQVEEDVNSQFSRLQKLMNKRMDVMLFGDFHARPEEVENVLHKIIATDGKAYTNPPVIDFSVLKKPLFAEDLYFSGVSSFDEWIKKINLAIQAGKKSGDIDRIFDSRIRIK